MRILPSPHFCSFSSYSSTSNVSFTLFKWHPQVSIYILFFVCTECNIRTPRKWRWCKGKKVKESKRYKAFYAFSHSVIQKKEKKNLKRKLNGNVEFNLIAVKKMRWWRFLHPPKIHRKFCVKFFIWRGKLIKLRLRWTFFKKNFLFYLILFC